MRVLSPTIHIVLLPWNQGCYLVFSIREKRIDVLQVVHGNRRVAASVVDCVPVGRQNPGKHAQSAGEGMSRPTPPVDLHVSRRLTRITSRDPAICGPNLHETRRFNTKKGIAIGNKGHRYQEQEATSLLALLVTRSY